MNIRLFIGAACVMALGGCAGSKDAGQSEPTAMVGLASCGPDDLQYCNGLAGKTHRSWGPTQFEYFAPDGKLYLWIGKNIRTGEWRVGKNMFGPVICYKYGPSPTDCRKLSSELKMKDGTVDGDPFGLSTRGQPPFDLLFGERRSTSELLAKSGASPTTGQR